MRKHRQTYRKPATGSVITVAPLPADLARPRDPEATRLVAGVVAGGALFALDVVLLLVVLVLP